MGEGRVGGRLGYGRQEQRRATSDEQRGKRQWRRAERGGRVKYKKREQVERGGGAAIIRGRRRGRGEEGQRRRARGRGCTGADIDSTYVQSGSNRGLFVKGGGGGCHFENGCGSAGSIWRAQRMDWMDGRKDRLTDGRPWTVVAVDGCDDGGWWW